MANEIQGECMIFAGIGALEDCLRILAEEQHPEHQLAQGSYKTDHHEDAPQWCAFDGQDGGERSHVA
jgi:hypothetical protein